MGLLDIETIKQVTASQSLQTMVSLNPVISVSSPGATSASFEQTPTQTSTPTSSTPVSTGYPSMSLPSNANAISGIPSTTKASMGLFDDPMILLILAGAAALMLLSGKKKGRV